ncbi:OmpA family protein [Pontibacter harenae]|uniref:OmpA family protein n=1 Tax=Pontibacter harenae TaxID=2894083 RepID=UPI001E3C5DC7|nr:OmpA family protein [Pontibacter harenae]MCC9165456.1 OmpA family protein [Pontibacter harenae]
MKNIKSIALIAALGLFTACNENNRVEEAGVSELASADTAVMYGDDRARVEADGAEIKEVGEGFWANVDLDAPVANDNRFTNSGIERRSSQGYNIYMMDERILFDLDKATLRSGADEKLNSIVESIKEVGGSQAPIRVYGYTDYLASKEYNKQLAEERANNVKNWLQQNTELDASRISTQAVGEANPRATNDTAEGRQKNRRVAIVVATQQ